MRAFRQVLAFSLVLTLFAVAPTVAQDLPERVPTDTTAVVRIDLTDGSSFVGTVVREDADILVLRTTAGAEVTIPRAQIRRMAPFAGRIDAGRVVAYDPNRTRLLFTPTARALGQGEGYLAVYELFFPFVAIGITDEISVAGGTVLFPGAFGRVLYVAPKVTLVQQQSLSVALGGVGLGVFVDDESVTAGIGYGLVTYGSPERAVTVGAGFAFAEGELASGALLTVGGEIQVSNSIKLLTENYLIPIEESIYEPDPGNPGSWSERTSTKYEPIFSFGVRFFGERLAVDLAGWTSPELLGDDLFPFFPWVGFAYNFGR